MKLSTTRFVITPPHYFFPIHLAGHAIRTQPSNGILDDIVGTIFLFDDITTQMVWISLELIGMDKNVSDGICAEVSLALNIPKENIVISFTHSHSAPKNYVKNSFEESNQETTKAYMSWVNDQIRTSIRSIQDKEKVDVTCQARVTCISGLYGNRNSLADSGDKSFVEIQFLDETKHVVATCVNFCCHPTVLGPQNLKISGDLAGAIRRHIENRDHALCMITLGAAGNMSSRLYRKGDDAKELERLSSEIMTQVNGNSVWTPVRMNRLLIKTYSYKQNYILDLDEKKQLLEVVKQRVLRAHDFDTKKVYTSAQSFLENQIRHFEKNNVFELDCRYIELGEIQIFTLPAELFSQFGQKIKQFMRKKYSFLWGYTFYNAGYLYNIEEKGNSFESIISNIPAGTSETITEDICDYLSKQ